MQLAPVHAALQHPSGTIFRSQPGDILLGVSQGTFKKRLTEGFFLDKAVTIAYSQQWVILRLATRSASILLAFFVFYGRQSRHQSKAKCQLSVRNKLLRMNSYEQKCR